MKKIFMFLTLSLATFIGINAVNAEEIDINTIEPNTYIIGERVYELNEHKLSMFDIVNAQAEYSEKYHKVAPILYLGVDLMSGETYIKVTTGANTSEKKEVEEVFPEGKVEVTTINNELTENFVSINVEKQIIDAVNKLNETANAAGFEKIEYKDKVGTFYIAEAGLENKLIDYKDSGIIEYFMTIATNAKEITFADGTKEDLTVLNYNKVKSIAAKVLKSIATSEDLTYASVANKEVSATIVYLVNGQEVPVQYTVKFVA